MRQERTVQASVFDLFAQHEIGCELKKASKWLDEHPTLLGLVAADLRRDGVQETGRHGLPAEAVLRCALLKQSRQLSYEELAFHLEDSASFRAFARLPWPWSPKRSALHKTIGAIRRRAGAGIAVRVTDVDSTPEPGRVVAAPFVCVRRRRSLNQPDVLL